MSKKINKQGIIVDDGNNVLLDLRQHIGEANPHKTKFVDLEEKPTTIAGYGITDAVKKFSDLEEIPTTIAGYGITDAVKKFSDLEEIPTTIAGYGITVAVGFPKYATVDLPTLDVLEAGSVVFDTDRVKLLLWNGTDWVSIDTTSI